MFIFTHVTVFDLLFSLLNFFLCCVQCVGVYVFIRGEKKETCLICLKSHFSGSNNNNFD